MNILLHQKLQLHKSFMLKKNNDNHADDIDNGIYHSIPIPRIEEELHQFDRFKYENSVDKPLGKGKRNQANVVMEKHKKDEDLTAFLLIGQVRFELLKKSWLDKRTKHWDTMATKPKFDDDLSGERISSKSRLKHLKEVKWIFRSLWGIINTGPLDEYMAVYLQVLLKECGWDIVKDYGFNDNTYTSVIVTLSFQPNNLIDDLVQHFRTHAHTYSISFYQRNRSLPEVRCQYLVQTKFGMRMFDSSKSGEQNWRFWQMNLFDIFFKHRLEMSTVARDGITFIRDDVRAYKARRRTLATASGSNRLKEALDDMAGIHLHLGGSYYSFPCSILSTGKDALPSDTVKNPKLNVNSTTLVLPALSYPTKYPQCSSHIHGLINAITMCSKQPNKSHNDQPQDRDMIAEECKTSEEEGKEGRERRPRKHQHQPTLTT
ncbi:hypothetical protein Tco_0824546 [Tanacetum coccineum]|uniref:Uncharacterized protein n=1 Tax=Tanacetum coccineum TaxID=301880 RepID=A0ABQ5ANP8_9ASTR